MDTTNYGGYLEVNSGKKWYFENPRPEDVSLRDIAHALSNLCRFGGHTNNFYSVAEHSVYVSQQVPKEHALSALLHDASEAYLVDMPRPLKQTMARYFELEEKNWLAIATHFDLPLVMDKSIHAADNAVLLAEKAQIVTSGEPWEWAKGLPVADVVIACYPPPVAKNFFLERFEELTGLKGLLYV